MSSTHLYIHVPFCKNLCPYCPYNKIEYESDLVDPFLRSILNEIDLYHDLLGEVEISSIYVGGGTPTLLIDQLGAIFEHLNRRFKIVGSICIELGPGDTNAEIASKLRDYGVDLVSLGVQSFQEKWLRFIGRRYTSSILNCAIEALMNAQFESVNMDLIFALPGQSEDDVTYDLEKAMASGVDQITTYPLFTFPYSKIGEFLKLKTVRMPELRTRHKLYMHVNEYLLREGFERVSVWSFKKGDAPRYSSVTRNGYIGLGPSAGSHTDNGFYLNTFSVQKYLEKCLNGGFPLALYMPFTKAMQHYFWLYWRLYDTRIPKTELREEPGCNGKTDQLLALLKRLGLMIENDTHYELNAKGAFWVHLAQNYFSLDYIDKIWRVAMKTPFPEKIVI